MRHIFTRQECSDGGKIRSQQESFQAACEKGYAMLQAKRPDVWRSIYKYRVKPAMQRKQSCSN